MGKGNIFSFTHIEDLCTGLKLLLNNFIYNPSPEDKLLDWSKLKQIADDILDCI